MQLYGIKYSYLIWIIFKQFYLNLNSSIPIYQVFQSNMNNFQTVLFEF